MEQLHPETTIFQTVFGEDTASGYWFLMSWVLLQENDRMNFETPLEQTQAAITAVALKKLLAEFYNRMEECGNDIGSIDVFSALDALNIGEENVWFLAGQESKCDAEFTHMINEREDIHDMLDYMIMKESAEISKLLFTTFDKKVIFAQMAATALLSENNREGFASQEDYLEQARSCYERFDDLKMIYGACFDWIENGMHL